MEQMESAEGMRGQQWAGEIEEKVVFRRESRPLLRNFVDAGATAGGEQHDWSVGAILSRRGEFPVTFSVRLRAGEVLLGRD